VNAPRPTPPSLAVWMLERALASDARDVIVGDLAERFAQDAAARGFRAARWRFWWEALVALRHFSAFGTWRNSLLREASMSSFIADLRHGARILRLAPGFAAVAILTIALAIGPTTAVFSIVDPLLIEPLPYPHADRLAFVFERGQDGRPTPIGYQTLQDIRDRATLLASVAAISSTQSTLSDPTQPERLDGLRVSWNYLSTLGVHTMLGRAFTREEDAPNGPGVIILSHGLWTRRFGADSGIVGRAVRMDGRLRTVVGVLPASYDDVVATTRNAGAEFFVPLGYAVTLPWACRTCRHLTAIARIRDGVDRQRALAELNQISAQLVSAYPKEYAAAGMFLTPMQEEVTRAARPALLAVLGAVALVLLIAVGNVVNLQLARAVRRSGEFAVRIALGAGAGRLRQQLVAESLVLAAAGGSLGVALAWLTLPVLRAQLPHETPRMAAVRVDVRVLVATMALVVVVAIVMGLVPARMARRRASFDGTLRGGGRVGQPSHHRTRALLVASELALAMMLLVSATLLGRSLSRLLAIDPGFEAANLVTLQIESAGPNYARMASVTAYRERVLDAVRDVPGVVDAATVTTLPLSGDIDRYGITAQDRPLANPELAPYANGYRVIGDLFLTMRIRLLEGRDLDRRDQGDTVASPIILSAGLARTLWGTTHVVGKRVHVPNARANWSTVVGVAGDIHNRALDASDENAIYVPESNWSFANSGAVLVVRTRNTSAALIQAVRDAAHAIDPSQPIVGVRTMDAVVHASAGQRRLALLLFGVFAGLALVLAGAGIYGVLAGSVAERTREIGLRSALGATPANVIRLVLNRGLGLAAAGIGAGMVGAVGLTRFLKSLLFGIAPTDPGTLAGAAVVLLAVAVIACLIPARRALRIDPVEALRAS
jgi:putative ABC transport system permease protein